MIQKFFEKITTIVIGVATIVVDQITTIVVGIATIVVFCDNRGWWLIVTIVITSSSSNIQNISIKIDSIKIYSLVLFIIYLRYMTYINDSECRQQRLLDVMYLLVGDDIITCQAHISSFCMCIMSSGKH